MSAQRDNSPRVVAFRVDASLEMGTGHVMRCLTLARALSKQGATCHFLCRDHTGHLMNAIETNGFSIHALSNADSNDAAPQSTKAPAHAHWLGASWQQDAEQSRSIIQDIGPDWLVVDHYALDARWENAALPDATRLLVIDDLADRPHAADALLDQNLGRQAEDYEHLVPGHCDLMIGPQYALLRPEFAQWRPYSLERREHRRECQELLISLGGVDKDNVTGIVLDALQQSDLPAKCHVTVVMGATAPWLGTVREQAAKLPWSTEVVVNVDDMARRMANADLAIGAAGSTSWERCALGLPAIMIVIAENQKMIARYLAEHGAVICAGNAYSSGLKFEISNSISNIQRPSTKLGHMAESCFRLVDGLGTDKVSSTILNYGCP
ncbi:UDP-2,4-diacetamido-2,4,6-trideoxy-beta-L-altropyranose hydrolase [Kushneria indalinina]|uniref:UDP-2,4-diacetamido-2,4, 6-trideoxy-beta-L-altropyranose hydrolase n=1 Tax=Kushneria indalinina DSM 14324 TaxID=1122140 RepID=A0A3D9DU43_9GAMM|nr:UDP-2,4-diacetamido-2,4,6-trideoxy-beta-L-altropyranose hydrolase [Kushneria indalinina]REC94283.1 UDP-2,4-diacetamido-2,4,6-trideoxy-beta-L-altropyranose hydrolase [Kushneria indalinina DSM 14324]